MGITTDAWLLRYMTS
uniref:Uncharacterized protein n=1 Tax=Arundo donax TaxID=35708 RepID=A0A0A9BIB9_ARUDO